MAVDKSLALMPPDGLSWLREADAGVSLSIRVIPRARSDEVAGLHGDALKIRVSAPAVEGAANRALTAFLARILKVRRQQIHIVSGERSRQKRVHVAGLSIDDAHQQLMPLLEK